MKKLVIIFGLIIIIIMGESYLYFTYNKNKNNILEQNAKYEEYYDKEITGRDIASLINMAVDSNEKNKVEKDEKNKYIDNGKNSIKIDIKIIDNDTIYDMETLYSGGIENFVQFYNTIQFKCTDIKYHADTKKVKYLYIEQITQ